MPNGTAWWQVHDSEENNGCFQREMVLAKKNFLTEKRNKGAGVGLKVQIEKFESVILLKTPLLKAYCNQEKNKKVISNRGWNPLNCRLVCDLEICRTATEDDKLQESSEPYYDSSFFNTLEVEEVVPTSTLMAENNVSEKPLLNVLTGYARSSIQALLDAQYQNELVANSKKRHSDGYTVHERVMNLKKIAVELFLMQGNQSLIMMFLKKMFIVRGKNSISRLRQLKLLRK